jgi:hypothetical protein
MNKYELLFNEIMQKTRNEKLKWKQLKRNANSELIFSANLVFRQFSAAFEREGAEFELLLIEKKYEDPDYDYVYDKYRPELLVIDDDGELIITLTDSVIERNDLIRLADLVETKTDRANKLFGL